MLKLFIASAFAALAATQAVAQNACPMTYETFEFAVPHLDLQECPQDLARTGTFCRVTTANDSVHVFVFEEKGKQCLVAVKSYSDYEISVK